MCENIITRDSSEFKELRRNIIRAINRQIPYTSIGGKILYPQSALHKLLESHYVRAIR